jgi:hypothetical protein
MTIVVEILDRSIPQEIGGKYRRKSQTYEAIRQYLVEADQVVIDRRRCIAVLDTDIPSKEGARRSSEYEGNAF